MVQSPGKNKDAATDAPAPWYGDIPGLIEDTRAAAAFLVRIRGIATPSAAFPGRLGRSMRAFPLVGGAIGLIGALTFSLLSSLSLPPMAAAIGTLAVWVVLTGALHEDGLADSIDALSVPPVGTVTQQRRKRLAILHSEAPIGAGGAWALIGVVIANVALLAHLDHAGAALIAAAALSRTAIVVFAASLPVLESSTLARAGGSPDVGQGTFAVLLAVPIALMTLGPGGTVQAFVLSGLGILVWSRLCRSRFGGYNGDLCGALQQGIQTIVIASAALRL